jgi:hypothetical protein
LAAVPTTQGQAFKAGQSLPHHLARRPRPHPAVQANEPTAVASVASASTCTTSTRMLSVTAVALVRPQQKVGPYLQEKGGAG